MDLIEDFTNEAGAVELEVKKLFIVGDGCDEIVGLEIGKHLRSQFIRFSGKSEARQGDGKIHALFSIVDAGVGLIEGQRGECV